MSQGSTIELESSGLFINDTQIQPAMKEFGLFLDVPPSYWASDMIIAVYNSGITGGCSTTRPLFCPDDTLTRTQMAVFMLASLGQLPAESCTGMFEDVDTSPAGDIFCRYIEKFGILGITGGCGGRRFCPNDPVTRQQCCIRRGRSREIACNFMYGEIWGCQCGDRGRHLLPVY